MATRLTGFEIRRFNYDMSSIFRAIVAITATYGAGLIGSLFISTDIGSWYEQLEKPFFMPPDWIFMPVWIVLYGFMSLALYLVWERDEDAKDWHGWVPLYFAHLVANIGWNVFFFGFHAVFLSLICIVILVYAIVMLIAGASSVSRFACILLLPYLLWVLFAAVLTASIWHLN